MTSNLDVVRGAHNDLKCRIVQMATNVGGSPEIGAMILNFVRLRIYDFAMVQKLARDALPLREAIGAIESWGVEVGMKFERERAPVRKLPRRASVPLVE